MVGAVDRVGFGAAESRLREGSRYGRASSLPVVFVLVDFSVVVSDSGSPAVAAELAIMPYDTASVIATVAARRTGFMARTPL
jgi:hypothetical protein